MTAAVSNGADLADLLEKTKQRSEAVDRFSNAYRQYIWPVSSVDDLKIAPFHLLASEGRVYADADHAWHMKTLAELADSNEHILMTTNWREVDLADLGSCAATTSWWEAQIASGGEGMVVKPKDFAIRGKKGLIQPAVKVRGKEYLRIIYGPDYDMPQYLERLKERGLGRKRSLAIREFSLGLEALQRFARHEPLARVHECVFGVLALETEPVDPRL